MILTASRTNDHKKTPFAKKGALRAALNRGALHEQGVQALRRRVVTPRPAKAKTTRAKEAGSGTRLITNGIVELLNDALIWPVGPPFWV